MIDGGKIKERREALGLSQAELARRARVSQPTISAIEAGDTLSSRALPRIASALQMEVAELDPEFPSSLPEEPIDLKLIGCAFEVLVAILRPEFSAQDLESLARVFLDLVLEPLDDKNGLSPREQLRQRLSEALIRQFLNRN